MKTIFRVSLVVVTLLTMVLTACAPAPTPTPVPPTPIAPTPVPPTPTPVPPTPTPVEVVILTQWDEVTAVTESELMYAVIAEFEKLNPDIKIKRDPVGEDELGELSKAVFPAGTAPSILTRDVGFVAGGALAVEGWLFPLDEAYKEYGWDKRILPSSVEFATYEGKVYGIPAIVEFIGMYYNKDILEELGVDVPKTHEEIEALAEKAQAAGYIPFCLGAKDRWPVAWWIEGPMGSEFGSHDAVNNMILGCETLDRPEMVRLVKIVEDFGKKGYFGPDPAALGYGEMMSMFGAGKCAAMCNGTWAMGEAEEMLGEKLAFTAYPPFEGKPAVLAGGVGYAFFIPEQTEHKEQALRWLDFLFSEEIARRFMEEAKGPSSWSPVVTDIETLKVSPAFKAAMKELQVAPLARLLEVWVTAPTGELLYDGLVEVVAGVETAEGLVKRLNEQWQKDIAEGLMPTCK